MSRATYKEDRWVAEVEVLADLSTDDGEGYRLRVIRTVEEDPRFVSAEDGHEFEVWKAHGAPSYLTWKLRMEDAPCSPPSEGQRAATGEVV